MLSDAHVSILSATVSTTRDRVAVSRFTFEMGDPKHLGHLLRSAPSRAFTTLPRHELTRGPPARAGVGGREGGRSTAAAVPMGRRGGGGRSCTTSIRTSSTARWSTTDTLVEFSAALIVHRAGGWRLARAHLLEGVGFSAQYARDPRAPGIAR